MNDDGGGMAEYYAPREYVPDDTPAPHRELWEAIYSSEQTITALRALVHEMLALLISLAVRVEHLERESYNP